jgi:hypothetical protein
MGNFLTNRITKFWRRILHFIQYVATFLRSGSVLIYSASHSRVAPENVGLQKEQKYNTFACHTCNEVRLCVLW